MSIDLTKPVRTRDGRAVRLLATDLKSPYPVLGVITEKLGHEFVCTYTLTGREFTGAETKNDLENIPDEKKEFYILWDNKTSFSTGTVWATLEMAQMYAEGSLSYAGVLEITKINGKITEVKHHAR